MMVLHDAATRQWLRFTAPHQILKAHRLDEVRACVAEAEALAYAHGYHVAGYIGYEAAPAFDAALLAQPPTALPLVWLGLYGPPEVIQLPTPTPTDPPYTLGAWRPSVDRATYNAALARIKQHIAQGDTYQVNYTLRWRADFAGEAWALWLDLVSAQQPAYAAYLDVGDFVIASASPELFFQLHDHHLTARPMKGTAARGHTLAEDEVQKAWLHASAKNRAENVMIVDMLRHDLGRIARVGSVHVPRLFEIERYPTLLQMTSTITAESEVSFGQILAALFPCASITGAPKASTMRIIKDLETTPRGVYTGAIGFFAPPLAEAPRRAQFNVAIRTVVIDRAAQTAEYGVGGGIVWDSEAEEEYAECELKARILTTRQPAFSLVETLRWTPGEGYFLRDRHWQRLRDSAEYFGFRADPTEWQKTLDAGAGALAPTPQRVRVLLSREGRFQCEAQPLEANPSAPVRLGLAPMPMNSNDIWLYHKTTHRAVYEAARAACPECDEVLLWNERGELTETCLGNVVLQLNGAWLTPPIVSGLLGGTFRAALLAEEAIRERVLTRADLAQAEKIFVINSVRGWREGQLTAT